MTAWPRVPVRRLFTVVNGGTPTADEDNWEGDIPWATPADLALVNGASLGATARTLTPKGLRTGSTLVPAASLIVSTRAPIGYVAEASTPVAFNQGCRALVARAPVVPRFFLYQLLSLAQDLDARGQGTTFAELSTDALASVSVRCPSIDDQRAVTRFLDAETIRIDALVQKKRRMVELLVERCSATSADMYLSLFDRPSVRLGRVARIFSGTGFPHDEQGRSHGDYPFFKVGDFARAGNERELTVCGNHIDETQRQRLGARIAPGGSVLFPKVGAALLRNQRRITVVPSAFDNNIMAVVPSAFDARFMHFMLSQLDLGELANPGPVPSINEDAVSDLRVPLVPAKRQPALLRALDEQIRPLVAARLGLLKQIDLLVEHRHALITAAVSGDLAAVVAT